jgi:hypothetical protein
MNSDGISDVIISVYSAVLLSQSHIQITTGSHRYQKTSTESMVLAS